MNIRLYHPDSIVENSTKLLSKEQTHYIVNVMRLKRGSNINFFNKEGEWISEIIFLDKDRVEVRYLNQIKGKTKLSNVELAICLIKKSPLELIFQKAAELGVSKIIPVISERTEIKDLNYIRAKKILVEATEQSNQLNPPIISDVIKLKDFLKNLGTSNLLLFADINSKRKLTLENSKKFKIYTILIGPEGDFTSNERELILKNSNTRDFTISDNILRSETAVISAISLVNFIKNDH